MYRGSVGSKAEVASVDRKRINDVLDKQLERSSPSTSRTINGKDRSSSSSLLTAKDHRDPRSASITLPKNASDGEFSI
jgi:casein kinase II subunit beta